MNARGPEMTTEMLNAAEMRERQGELLDVYLDAYADKIHLPFFTPERFWERLEAYSSHGGFSLAASRQETGQMVGYALGYTLPAESRWWAGLLNPVEAMLIQEDGHRTFALNYLMVRHLWRRRGVARTLHGALMANRAESRAALLVLPDNIAAVAAYMKWGWYKIGELRPFVDAPTYDAMLLELIPVSLT